MPSGQDLTERLTAEARRALETYVAASDADVENLQALVTSLLERYRARARNLTQLEYAFDRIVGDAMSQAREPAEHAARSAREGLDFIAGFSAQLRSKETQEEILTHLLDGVSRFAPVVALLAVHDESIDGWAARGFPAPVEHRIAGSSLSRGDSAWLERTLEGTEVVENLNLSGESRLKSILEHEAGGSWAALPLRVLSKPAAVVIARGTVDSPPDAKALGLLIDLTALSLENTALRILRQMQSAAAAEVPAQPPVESAAASAVEPEVAAVVEMVEAPEAESTAVPVVEAVDQVIAVAEEPPAPAIVESAAAAEEPAAVEVETVVAAVEVPVEPATPPAEALAAPVEVIETAVEAGGPPAEPLEAPAEASQPAPPERVEVTAEAEPAPVAAAVAPEVTEVEASPQGEVAQRPPAPAADGSVGELDRTLEVISQTLQSIETEALRSESPVAAAPVSVSVPEPPVVAAPELVPVPEPPAVAAPELVPVPEPPAPAPEPEPVKMAPPSPVVPARPAPIPVAAPQPPSEEEKLHSDAKRFARLLVTEIKLYNEQHMMEGRENRDIYVRLKRDIDRSREMYEKRVAPVVSRKVDYFHDEIVRILGDNDASTLGSDYPGSRAES